MKVQLERDLHAIVSHALLQQAADFETKMHTQLHASNLFHTQLHSSNLFHTQHYYSLIQEQLNASNLFHTQRHSALQTQIDELNAKLGLN